MIFDLNSRFAVKENVVSKDLAGEVVLLDLHGGTYFGLNPVGADVWQGLKDGHSGAEICDALCRKYNVAREIAEQDSQALIGQFIEKDLIDVLPPTGHRNASTERG